MSLMLKSVVNIFKHVTSIHSSPISVTNIYVALQISVDQKYFIFSSLQLILYKFPLQKRILMELGSWRSSSLAEIQVSFLVHLKF